MDLSFSYQDFASLFGLGLDLTTSQRKLDAAICFQATRTAAANQLIRLKSIKKRQFMRKPERFRKTVQTTLEIGSTYGDLILPLLGKRTNQYDLKLFILACLLPANNLDGLVTAGLTSIFPELFRANIGEITMLAETYDACIEILKDVSNETGSGHILTAAIQSAEGLETPQHSRRSSIYHRTEPKPLLFSNNELDTPNTGRMPPTVAMGLRVQAAEADHLEGALGYSPFLFAIKTSHQWRMDSEALPSQHPRWTNCVSAMAPQSPGDDITFMITTGYNAGWRIIRHLRFNDSVRVNMS